MSDASGDNHRCDNWHVRMINERMLIVGIELAMMILWRKHFNQHRIECCPRCYHPKRMHQVNEFLIKFISGSLSMRLNTSWFFLALRSSSQLFYRDYDHNIDLYNERPSDHRSVFWNRKCKFARLILQICPAREKLVVFIHDRYLNASYPERIFLTWPPGMPCRITLRQCWAYTKAACIVSTQYSCITTAGYSRKRQQCLLVEFLPKINSMISHYPVYRRKKTDLFLTLRIHRDRGSHQS